MNTIDGTRTKGLLNLVDLAGSERFDRTGAGNSVELKNEGIAINQSLTSLGLVIKCLTESPRPKHIPYRSSKLTQILKNSLGGNARTVLLLNCSPVDLQTETLNTLRFGLRAKLVKNAAKINREDIAAELGELRDQLYLKDRLIAELRAEIALLRKMLSDRKIPLPSERQI